MINGSMKSDNSYCLERRLGKPDGSSVTKYISNETKIHFAPNSGETLEVVRLASRPLQDLATLITLMEVLGGQGRDEGNSTGEAATFSAAWFLDLFRGFDSEFAMVNASMGKKNLRKVLAAVSFYPRVNGTLPETTRYAIRMSPLVAADPTRNSRSGYWSSTYGEYLNTGFSLLQDAFDHAIIDFRAGDHVGQTATFAQPFPKPLHFVDDFSENIGGVLPLFMVLAWIYSMSLTTKAIVYEKENRLREAMKMMGLGTGVHLAAWFITTMLVLSTSTVLLTIILKVASILPRSDWTLVFCVLELFALSSCALALLLSSFFSKAKLAAAVTGIIYFCLYLPFIFIDTQTYGTVSFAAKIMASLSSTTAFGMGVSIMASMEGRNKGATWAGLNEGTAACDQYTLATSLQMLAVDAVLYLVLAWYIQEVFPGQYGVPQSPFFFLRSSYWCGTSGRSSRSVPATGTHLPVETSGSAVVEPYGTERAHVQLRNLSKSYASGCGPCAADGHVQAVSGLSLDVVEGQITALLGHNGAGKSTLMGLISGLFPVSGGEATVYGSDIRYDIEGVRQSLGVCPQYNVLFDDLSAEEHLLLTARLKGMTWTNARREASRYLADLGLSEAKDTLSKNLSGGMKRKLCVCMAFIGGSKLVILDEPTAGMDPRARRTCWDLLLKYKSSRTILLSTHHMDEADLLGDRVAIMTTGHLRCVGSPLFLKRHYGAGYDLVTTTNRASCDQQALTEHLQKTAPNAVLRETKGADLTFRFSAADSVLFGDLLARLEASKERLGVLGYGVRATTLEEVFLSVMAASGVNDIDEGADTRTRAPTQPETVLGTESHSLQAGDSSIQGGGGFEEEEPLLPTSPSLRKPTSSVTGFSLHLQRVKAMLRKRYCHSKRDRKALVSQVLLPSAFVCIAMGVAIASPPVANLPSVNLSFDLFNNACGKPQPNVAVLHVDSPSPFAQAMGSAMREMAPDHIDLSNDSTFLHPTGTCGKACEYPNNISSYLLNTYSTVGNSRYGAISIEPLNSSFVQLSNGYHGSDPLLVRPWFDIRWLQSLPSFHNFLNNAILRAATNSSRYKIETLNWPLNNTADDMTAQYLKSGTDLTCAINILIAMAFIPASFAVYVVAERANKAKHLQYTSGVGVVEYWLGNYLWDLMNYLVPAVVTLAIFLAFNLPTYTGRNFPAVALLLLFYGFSVTPMMYPLTFLFSIPSTAYVSLICINLFFGITCTLTTFILELFPGNPGLDAVNGALRWIFLLFPNYALGRGLMDVAKNQYESQ